MGSPFSLLCRRNAEIEFSGQMGLGFSPLIGGSLRRNWSEIWDGEMDIGVYNSGDAPVTCLLPFGPKANKSKDCKFFLISKLYIIYIVRSL